MDGNQPPSDLASLFRPNPKAEVRRTQEFQRVLQLPRRQWTETTAKELAALYTPLLKKPGGTMALRPIQAQALHDAGICGGLLAPLRVGGGKTLITALLPWVLQARRPLLLIPAALVEKTKREFGELAKHWQVEDKKIFVMSYELLGRSQSAEWLTNYRPDCIIADEGHRLKNTRAAVTKRVARYLKLAREDWHHKVKVCILSGTITKRSIRDYAHLIQWCLQTGAPLPLNYTEVEEWSNAIDEKSNPLSRMGPGPLGEFCTLEDQDEDALATIRKGFRRRLAETPGVVATTTGHLACSLYIDASRLHCPDAKLSGIEGAFSKLRAEWKTPDDWEIADGVTMWRHARELALGFYYRWNPRPPLEWLIPRQEWNRYVREVIKNSAHSNHPMDSEKQVAHAISQGKLGAEAHDLHASWREIEPTFEPNTEAVWLDDSTVDACAEWLAKHPKGIVWSEHTAFGERLAAKAGVPYFGREGKDKDGRLIDAGGISGPVVASRQSNSTGRNLQAWNQNLLPSFPGNAEQVEQLVGRTHREGQEEDEVSVDVLVSCIEHVDSLEKCLLEAKYIQDSTGQPQKLLYADLTMPSNLSILTLPSRRFHR